MALYVPACPEWSTMIWQYGPAGYYAATAGGSTGVPLCMAADGSSAIQPTFVLLPETATNPAFPGVMDTLFNNADVVQLLITGGFDATSFNLGLSGVVLMFVVGLGVGVVAGIVRKAR